MDKISVEAAAILEGLNEALADAKGTEVQGIKKCVVNRIEPKIIRQKLHMSQMEFSCAFGIPLATLQNWEQGRRKIDSTAASLLRTIMMFPDAVKAAQG